MSNFALDTNSSSGDIISSLNYALANLGSATAAINYNGNIMVANTITGIISSISSSGVVQYGQIQYLYSYIDVAYANTATGGGFTSNCTNQQYYGIRNTSSPTWDTNPVDYTWTQVSGGFSTNKFLFYTPLGGSQILFSIGATAPSVNYSPVIDSTPILLAKLANSSVTTDTISPGAVTGVQIAINTITGQNIGPNTITGYNINAGTITGNLIAANTIYGNSIVAGSITSTQIAAGTILVANSIQSTNATFDSPTSAGFWLDASNGSARFGSDLSVGNNLTVGTNAQISSNLNIGTNARIGNNLFVGNNASIGGNLNVSGLITTSALQANTVVTNNIYVASVTDQAAGYSSTTETINGGGSSGHYTSTSTTITVTPSNAPNGAILYVTGRQMAYLSYTAASPGTMTANLGLIVVYGTQQTGIAWANVSGSYAAGTSIFPVSTGGLEVYVSNYPYVIPGAGTITVRAELFGNVTSGPGTFTSGSFDNYSPSTLQGQLRYNTAQVFKR
jgi:carbonic anhydrase/acetyltransferase-like protein (isoleucine patch superfamily)